MAHNKKIPKHAGVWEDFGASQVDAPATDGRPAGLETPLAARERAVRRTYGWIVLWSVAVLALVLGALADIRPPALLSAAAILQAAVLILLVVFNGHLRFLTGVVHSLAFFRRFIRPGLRRLLEHEGHIRVGDEKVFRGRKTVIMKIDMANYTRTTFHMPYGMRRLFQDLWFTLIDQVVADKIFLNKSLGDGSLYCFEDALPGGSAAAALEAALEIRERQVEHFDATFRQRLEELLATTPDLAGPAEAYFGARQGENFRERRTRIRIALVTGYVDEGLWGLSSQSHYDVHGGPLVLASRMEAAAENGEIVFDRDFLEELEEENPDLVDRSQLERRSVELKGVGSWEIFVLPMTK